MEEQASYEKFVAGLATLSAEYRRVLGFIVAGADNLTIARQLGLRPYIVRDRRKLLIAKLGAPGSDTIKLFAVRAGVIIPRS